MRKPQWITLAVAVALTAGLYIFGRTVPRAAEKKKPAMQASTDQQGHEVDMVNIDTILALAKKKLGAEQVVRLNTLENSISRGAVKDQQLKVYRQLAQFWYDSARIFEPYAWYMAEAARLENSEKSLTFAGHLFLENLQQDQVERRRVWKALQAKDLFERSLKLNPNNDSSKVGLGACYIFGGISAAPMEGIMKVREVADRDSSDLFAQLTLVKGSMLSGQYDKAIARLGTVTRLHPENVEALLMMADLHERKGDNRTAAEWYRKCLPLVNAEARAAIEQRIGELGK